MPENGSARRDDGGDSVPADGCRVDLQAAEVELLLKACENYRSTLPVYLLSAKEEMEIADELLEKLRSIQHSASSPTESREHSGTLDHGSAPTVSPGELRARSALFWTLDVDLILPFPPIDASVHARDDFLERRNRLILIVPILQLAIERAREVVDHCFQ